MVEPAPGVGKMGKGAEWAEGCDTAVQNQSHCLSQTVRRQMRQRSAAEG